MGLVWRCGVLARMLWMDIASREAASWGYRLAKEIKPKLAGGLRVRVVKRWGFRFSHNYVQRFVNSREFAFIAQSRVCE